MVYIRDVKEKTACEALLIGLCSTEMILLGMWQYLVNCESYPFQYISSIRVQRVENYQILQISLDNSKTTKPETCSEFAYVESNTPELIRSTCQAIADMFSYRIVWPSIAPALSVINSRTNPLHSWSYSLSALPAARTLAQL